VCDLETSRIGAPYICDISSLRVNDLTLILLTWRKWWTPNNASKWQMGFNSAFKGLKFMWPRNVYWRYRNDLPHMWQQQHYSMYRMWAFGLWKIIKKINVFYSYSLVQVIVLAFIIELNIRNTHHWLSGTPQHSGWLQCHCLPRTCSNLHPLPLRPQSAACHSSDCLPSHQTE